MSQIIDELPILETPCEACEGKGGNEDRGGLWYPCYACKGAGHQPTEAGMRVLALMRHNFGWMFREEKSFDKFVHQVD